MFALGFFLGAVCGMGFMSLCVASARAERKDNN